MAPRVISTDTLGGVPNAIGSPIVLSGRATINPNEIAPVNIEALRNPLKQPIAIREFRFAHTATYETANVVTSGAPLYGYALGFGVAVSIKIGKYQVTAKATPMSLFGRFESGMWENISSLAAQWGYNNPDQFVFYRWRLAEPVYVLPGEAIEVSMQHRGLTDAPIRTHVAAFGYATATVPKDRIVPAVLSVIKDAKLQPNIGMTTVSTTERDLQNTLGSTINVDHICGRCLTLGRRKFGSGGVQDPIDFSEGSSIAINTTFDSTIVLLGAAPSVATTTITGMASVTMRDYRGIVMADKVPFFDLFPIDSRVWDTRFSLPPNGYIINEVAHPTYDESLQMAPRALFGFSLVGHRKV